MTNSEYARMAVDEGREVADATVLAEVMAPRYVTIHCKNCGAAVDVVEAGREYDVIHCEHCGTVEVAAAA